MSQTPTCPICHKQLVGEADRQSEFFPFCSERCRHVDFFRWSEGKYAIVEPLTPSAEALGTDRFADETVEKPPELQ